ncbi:helix-turn-helix transcriptional regulator [Staphylococcus saprophyticus]|nr:helix-turn-helix transcriptional regulator [Staphylococcus saprophyticus]MDW4138780.1 helix-turn-helix transcriptional regulator [Staphylococcus saprophyticus]MDW4286963.1 helix-turn-helix transcriptional regulator [Staphylococcus saprophyticus]
MTNLAYPMLYVVYKEHGHTQKHLAKRLGISPQRFGLKMIGKTANFTLPEAKILSELYGMSIDELFSNSIKVGS